MNSVIVEWTVEVEGHERRFKISYANTFDEPVGGLMNVLLTDDGQHYQHTELNGGRSLVIDVGGFTTDWIVVSPGLPGPHPRHPPGLTAGYFTRLACTIHTQAFRAPSAGKHCALAGSWPGC